MTNERDDVFVASLKRCLTVADFLQRFYDAFVSSSEEVRDKFRNTDFKTQTRVLSDSLFMLAILPQGKPDGFVWEEMSRLSQRHSKADLNIEPRFYDLWLDCLLATAKDCDPDFSPEIEAAWRRALSVGIDYLSARY